MNKKILNEGKDGIAKVGKRFLPTICKVDIDDVAMIKNMSKESRVSIHC